MRSLNKVSLIGNLGKDPECQTLEGGISVAKFSLATTEIYKDDKAQYYAIQCLNVIVLCHLYKFR